MILTVQKYIFYVHQISTSGGKFKIFLARTRTKSTAQNIPKHAILSENFLWEGGYVPSPHPSAGGKGYPLPKPHP